MEEYGNRDIFNFNVDTCPQLLLFNFKKECNKLFHIEQDDISNIDLKARKYFYKNDPFTVRLKVSTGYTENDTIVLLYALVLTNTNNEFFYNNTHRICYNHIINLDELDSLLQLLKNIKKRYKQCFLT